MEYIVIVIGILFLAVSLAGCLIPGLPGPPLAFMSLIIVLYNPYVRGNMAESYFIWLILFALFVFAVSFSKKSSGDAIKTGIKGFLSGTIAKLAVIVSILCYFLYVVV